MTLVTGERETHLQSKRENENEGEVAFSGSRVKWFSIPTEFSGAQGLIKCLLNCTWEIFAHTSVQSNKCVYVRWGAILFFDIVIDSRNSSPKTFTHPHCIPKLYDLLSSAECKRRYFEGCLSTQWKSTGFNTQKQRNAFLVFHRKFKSYRFGTTWFYAEPFEFSLFLTKSYWMISEDLHYICLDSFCWAFSNLTASMENSDVNILPNISVWVSQSERKCIILHSVKLRNLLRVNTIIYEAIL